MSSTEARLALILRKNYTDSERLRIRLAVKDLSAAKNYLLAAGEVLKSSRIGLVIAELEGDMKYGTD